MAKEVEVDAAGLPVPVSAVTKHSPNRKPHIPWTAWRSMRRKDIFLRMFKDTGDMKAAAARVEQAMSTIYRWRQQDEDFAFVFEKIQRAWTEINKASIEGLNTKAIRVMEEALEQTDDPRLRQDTAWKLLKAAGYLIEKREVQHSGAIGVRVLSVEVVPLEAGVIVEPTPAAVGEGDDNDAVSTDN